MPLVIFFYDTILALVIINYYQLFLFIIGFKNDVIDFARSAAYCGVNPARYIPRKSITANRFSHPAIMFTGHWSSAV